MKTLFENMINMIMMVLVIFVFTSIISIQFQSIKANNIHTSALEALANSNYEINESYLNGQVDNGYFEISDINNYKQLTYHYYISVPFFRYSKPNQIVGVTR